MNVLRRLKELLTNELESLTLFMLVFQSVIFGVSLMVLEEIKNLIFTINRVYPIMVEAPLLGIRYSLPIAWDLALLLCVMCYCFSIVTSYRLARIKEATRSE